MNRENKLLRLLSEFRELGIDNQIDYDKFYLYSLITHSTAIEGSTVTEIENQLLFDEGISANGRSISEQLMNLDLKAAYEQSIVYAKSRSDISVDMLKKLAATVMKNTGSLYNTALGSFSSADGDLRLLNVTAGVGGSSYMNFLKVPTKLSELCDTVNVRRKQLASDDIIGVYKLSFNAHFRLVTIHPWADGNGRMSRLFMNQLQFEFGVIPVKIDKHSKVRYIEALIATRTSEDIELFENFMFDEHIVNLEQMIASYKRSMEQGDVPVNVPASVPVNLTKRQVGILGQIRLDSGVTAAELAVRFGVSDKTIKRDIAVLKSEGYIIRVGSDKRGFWELRSPDRGGFVELRIKK